MSDADRQLWDEKWSETEGTREVSDVLRQYRPYLGSGMALDVACGLGQNSIWLAQQGYRVLGVDLSSVALAEARRAAEESGLDGNVLFAQVDLDDWRPAPESVDLFCVLRFLDRALLPYLQLAVRPGGLAIYSTRHVGVLRRRPDANREYLLRRGELPESFAGWRVLDHSEGPENARMIARKPG
ncbi:MAG: class I SAM-dependent methyltransferase [Chloroflexota bacterium]